MELKCVKMISCLESSIRWYNSKFYTSISSVLNRSVSFDEAKRLYKDWHEFFNHPEDFKNTIVVDMVLQYLND